MTHQSTESWNPSIWRAAGQHVASGLILQNPGKDQKVKTVSQGQSLLLLSFTISIGGVKVQLLGGGQGCLATEEADVRKMQMRWRGSETSKLKTRQTLVAVAVILCVRVSLFGFVFYWRIVDRYSAVLVSGILQSDSVIHVSIYILKKKKFFSIIVALCVYTWRVL